MHITFPDVNTRLRVRTVRKTHWWERFRWFISPDNYLVIGGRDMHQNEVPLN